MGLFYLYFVLAALVAIMAEIRGRPAVRWFLIAVFTTPLVAGLLVMALPQVQPAAAPSRAELPEETVPVPAECTIRIYRRSSYADRQRPYEVFVNGAHVGSISPDTLVDFAVPCGELLVEARIDWGGSRPLMVEARPGRRAEIEVSNNWGPVFAHWAMTFHPGGYLALTQLPTVDTAALSQAARKGGQQSGAGTG